MHLALLTGRNGSVSLPNKNFAKVLDQPLMAYPAQVALHSRHVDDVYLSTDSLPLKRIAEDMGIHVIDRPPVLAQPDSQHRDVIEHALQYWSEHEIFPEIVVVLLCNVGTHHPNMIDHCIELLQRNSEVDSVVTVDVRNEYHPLRAKTMNENGYLEPFIGGQSSVSTNRQDLSPCYFLDHSIWALRVERCFGPNVQGQPPWDFMGNKILGVRNHGAIDVHSKEDLAYTEAWLQNHGWPWGGKEQA